MVDRRKRNIVTSVCFLIFFLVQSAPAEEVKNPFEMDSQSGKLRKQVEDLKQRGFVKEAMVDAQLRDEPNEVYLKTKNLIKKCVTSLNDNDVDVCSTKSRLGRLNLNEKMISKITSHCKTDFSTLRGVPAKTGHSNVSLRKLLLKKEIKEEIFFALLANQLCYQILNEKSVDNVPLNQRQTQDDQKQMK